jgi:hypothetical protein
VNHIHRSIARLVAQQELLRLVCRLQNGLNKTPIAPTVMGAAQQPT